MVSSFCPPSCGARGKETSRFLPAPSFKQDAFYLGVELAKAEIAWRLAKRYAQDEPLDWGVAADAPAEDRTRLKEAGHTLIAKRKRQAS